jgi:hypothetical protein
MNEGDEKMNRHERRRAAKVIEQGKLSRDELESLGCMCAWNGCQATCPSGPLPDGWRWLLMYWAPRPPLRMTDIPAETWDRDAVLCPQHAKALDGMLKELARWTSKPVAGSG